MKAAKEESSIIVISSHILDFVGSLADSNVFLKDGRIAAIEKCNENLEKNISDCTYNIKTSPDGRSIPGYPIWVSGDACTW